MAGAIISEVVSVIIKTLGSGAYKKITFARDLSSHIKRLQQLKTTIEALLLDARSLESCTNIQKDMVNKLDCALTDLVDFLDAKAAKAQQKEIMHGNKFIKEVRLFFSKSNQLVSPFRVAHKLKAIIEQFESISRDQALVRDIISVPSVIKTQMMSPGSLWSNCHILNEVVIGRDDDRDEIVNMLLDESLSTHNLSVVSIVGIGGVGKTTLAKYVYHDERVKNWFGVHLWVSVTQDFDVQKVLIKLLATLEDEMTANCGIAQMYNCLQLAICRKKFLLVLDNVWDQESLWEKWQDLKSLLSLGASGSKVLLTTRNKKVSRIMDCVNPYVLEDLTQENAWLLFQKIVFTQVRDPRLEAIGKEIVKLCPKVPLVIRSIGGLLAGKTTIMEWLAFRDDQLAKFSAYGHDIMQTLKLSYDQLDERLKLCVAYCSLFPKGYEYDPNEIIRLWISLGYIKPSYESQRLEDVAEEYILMLAIQGFFIIDQESTDYLRVHDLMHDLVLSIADFKYKMAEADVSEIDERVRHLSLVQKDSDTEPSTNMVSSIFKLRQLQSLLFLNRPFGWSSLYVSKKIFSIFPRLRILSLCDLGIEKVPSSLGELIALRYLDLSFNPITHLPNSITQLIELLSLKVSFCSKLHEFPKGIRKLVKLRHIRNIACPAVMPKGVASLTNLQRLDELQLEVSEWFPRESDDGLAKLNSIINKLTGEIEVHVNGDANSRSFKANNEHWESTGNLVWLGLYFIEGSRKGDETLIEAFQPNTNLRKLNISGFKGERLPKWMNDEIHRIRNLVEITLFDLEGCTSLGSFGRLFHLKRLDCHKLEKVEYIEENGYGRTKPYAPLFPSLEYLQLYKMPKLKKWYNVSNWEERSSCSNSHVQDNSSTLLALKLGFLKLKLLRVTRMSFFISMTREFIGFSSLEDLTISDCEDFKAIPDGIHKLSNLKYLKLFKCCEELKQRCRKPIGADWPKIKHIPFIGCYLHN